MVVFKKKRFVNVRYHQSPSLIRYKIKLNQQLMIIYDLSKWWVVEGHTKPSDRNLLCSDKWCWVIWPHATSIQKGNKNVCGTWCVQSTLQIILAVIIHSQRLWEKKNTTQTFTTRIKKNYRNLQKRFRYSCLYTITTWRSHLLKVQAPSLIWFSRLHSFRSIGITTSDWLEILGVEKRPSL